ncbi:hypothetical protein I8D64_01750 [Brachybacterium sp. MASK1Z-5]|uniref:DUF222 domain-containing protein n=1 Tax=Brachybacterium halotolerans TaxID=2795215 RepID=A0ABS1B6J7_9MICO|nr:hypothetical protein [Brachybacterium halotolerans]MBK0330127.1 hypothetical protein [Brachybacterium halotolerans]
MSWIRLPDVVHVELITDEVMALLRAKGPEALSDDAKIILASLLFADEEGIATFGSRTVPRWLSPGEVQLTYPECRERVLHVIAAGALAPGSRRKQLRSMIGRRAEVQEHEGAA